MRGLVAACNATMPLQLIRYLVHVQDYKYVWLAANSTFKADSDHAKYEKARKLKVRPQACAARTVPC